jgi:hypothetical protein
MTPIKTPFGFSTQLKPKFFIMSKAPSTKGLKNLKPKFFIMSKAPSTKGLKNLKPKFFIMSKAPSPKGLKNFFIMVERSEEHKNINQRLK